ncbi:A24 family peptidase [Halocatena pleomorpha]|uniref:A24 family peptidase n=1 Tax=Halocatena pleomorpha TaxID=1785090 RepID=A0A3P3RAQ1_9EURY|nr:A24 family peptidase [Halocatena pleomorpha]RRJ30474.1 A24 family peptidase [Halocatena pleomorpha]
MFLTLPDLFQLLVVPCIAWMGYHDVRTRRIPNWIWPPLAVVGLIVIFLNAVVVAPSVRVAFVLRCVVSLSAVAPIGWFCWRLNIAGGADAKAIGTLALVFPVYPTIYFRWGVLPIERASHGVFALTILTNTVLVGLVIPVALAVCNGVNGRIRPAMFVGRPYQITSVSSRYGQLLEDDTGRSLTGGLDLDALRLYLQWRDTSLAALRSAADTDRDPANCPSASASDHWGAAAFLSEIEGTAYGTTPEQLRDGLDRLCAEEAESVWVTPGLPFLAFVCFGLVIALIYGDVLSTIMRAL